MSIEPITEEHLVASWYRWTRNATAREVYALRAKEKRAYRRYRVRRHRLRYLVEVLDSHHVR